MSAPAASQLCPPDGVPVASVDLDLFTGADQFMCSCVEVLTSQASPFYFCILFILLPFT